MWFFYVVVLPVLLGTAGGLLWMMPNRGTHWAVKAHVGLAWFAALSTLLLVPSDVSAALAGHLCEDSSTATGLPTEPQPALCDMLAIWWKVAYYSCLGLMVSSLPLHQMYSDSGAFTIKTRLAHSLRHNLAFMGVCLALGAAGVLLLILSGTISPERIYSLALALPNAFGLIASIFLMGYGLVEIPRRLWRTADTHGWRRLLCHTAGVRAEKALMAHQTLSNTLAVVKKVDVLIGRGDPLRDARSYGEGKTPMDQLDRMIAYLSCEDVRFRPTGATVDPEDVAMDIITVEECAQLRRTFRRAIEDWEMEREMYMETVNQYIQVHNVIANAETGPQEFASMTHGARPPLLAKAEWWWKCRIRGALTRTLAVLFALWSAAVVLAECTIDSRVPNLSVFSIVLHRLKGESLRVEMVTFLFLLYPCAAAYYTLFKLGAMPFYRLVPRHTAPFSLISNALLMCRFAAPLAFNFMAAMLLPDSPRTGATSVRDTVFWRLFGQHIFEQSVLGVGFNTFAPLVLLPYMVLLAMGWFNAIIAFVTRSPVFSLDDDWEEASDYASKGSALLQQEVDNYVMGGLKGFTIDPDLAPPVVARSDHPTHNREYTPPSRTESPGESRRPNWFTSALSSLKGDNSAAEGASRPQARNLDSLFESMETSNRRGGGRGGRLVPAGDGDSDSEHELGGRRGGVLGHLYRR